MARPRPTWRCRKRQSLGFQKQKSRPQPAWIGTNCKSGLQQPPCPVIGSLTPQCASFLLQRMSPEIIWTPKDEDGPELAPGQITRIVSLAREVRIAFAGRDKYGNRYEGILRLLLRPGIQKLRGIQNFESDEINFSVIGEFQDDKFEVFEGTWFEPDFSCLVGVYGLPPISPRGTSNAKSTKKSPKVRKRTKRKKRKR